MKAAKFYDVAQLVVDSHFGIYSAQTLNERVNLDISDEDKAILADGPDNEQYIEVWADLSTCEGGTYHIHQIEGDIWIVPVDIEIVDLDEVYM
jgi:hypothetical protein